MKSPIGIYTTTTKMLSTLALAYLTIMLVRVDYGSCGRSYFFLDCLVTILPSLSHSACCDLFLNTQIPFLLICAKTLNQQLPWNSIINRIFPCGLWLPRDRSGTQWTMHWGIDVWNHIAAAL